MMDQYRNDSKYHVYYSFFENIISGIEVYTSLHVLVDIIRAFFYSGFSSIKSLSQWKLVKNITHFLKPHLFYEPQLTWHWKPYAPETQPKTFLTLQLSQQTCFCIVSKKKSVSKANVCIFLYISLKKFLFQRCSKILGGGIARGQRLNNFLKASCYLGLVKCTIFHFNLNFWKFNYFSAFLYCIYSIKTLKFSRQFWTLRVILWLNFSSHFSLNIKYDNKITA